MKTMKKTVFFVFSCVALSSNSIYCFFYDNGRPSYALQGAAIGGIAGGRKGAAIGLGVGAMSDIASSAATDSQRRRRYYDDEDYYERRRSRKRRKLEEQNEELQRRNEDLEARISALENRN